MHSETYPTDTARERDAYMQGYGFLEHYNIQLADDQNSGYTQAQQSTSRANKMHSGPTVSLPDTSSFAIAASAIIQEPMFKQADTVLILTDTDDLSSTRILKHFEKLGPLLFDRTTIQGPHQEQWSIAFHKTEGHDHRIHCTWAAVFLIEALITAVPWKHYILQDHDDTPLALFEVQQNVPSSIFL